MKFQLACWLLEAGWYLLTPRQRERLPEWLRAYNGRLNATKTNTEK